jgi:hypothetical protein
VVLDACRYDYFEKVYEKYLGKGDLKKAVSPAIQTMQWLNKIFPDKYDLVYISGNPIVNSKVLAKIAMGYEFDGKEHFSSIEDVWINDWDEDLKSVTPKAMNRAFFSRYEKDKNKKFVVHYIQPHIPYIGKKYSKHIKKGWSHQFVPAGFSKEKKTESKKSRKQKFKTWVKEGIVEYAGVTNFWRLYRLLKKDAESQTAAIYFEEGWEGVRNAYTENLELVLESVKEIVDSVEGNVLITADHGDFLGEHRRFGHHTKKRMKENTEVPWLMIKGRGKARKEKKSEKREENATKSDEQVMKERLAALGYI